MGLGTGKIPHKVTEEHPIFFFLISRYIIMAAHCRIISDDIEDVFPKNQNFITLI